MRKDEGWVGRWGICCFIMLHGCNIKQIGVDAFNVNAFIVVVGEIVIYFGCDIIVVIIRDS
jgi:hypothetical protein